VRLEARILPILLAQDLVRRYEQEGEDPAGMLNYRAVKVKPAFRERFKAADRRGRLLLLWDQMGLVQE
jgi:hypothetical protein